MLSREKKKICWDCGGEVPHSVRQCPFCGGDFSSSMNQDANMQHAAYVDPHVHASNNTEIPQTPYQAPYQASSSYEMSTESEDHFEEPDSIEKERRSTIALSFLLPGVTLFLLGIAMFLFAEDGYLNMRLDASYGVFVFILSLVFISLGARTYRRL